MKFNLTQTYVSAPHAFLLSSRLFVTLSCCVVAISLSTSDAFRKTPFVRGGNIKSRISTALVVSAVPVNSTISNGIPTPDQMYIEKYAPNCCPTDKFIPTEYVAETKLPTDVGQFRLRAYRTVATSEANSWIGNTHIGNEPCVIYYEDKPPGDIAKNGKGLKKALPVRIHDQCFTSEVFGSRRCDCNDQLKMSLSYIKEHGGCIIYLQQEGRGIGLANNVAAYALQDEGMDTVDANIHLGFPEDCREYGFVPGILQNMGVESIKLMTNNPLKIKRLSDLGVDVEGIIPMVVESANTHNRNYLETKANRMNHANLGTMLASKNTREDSECKLISNSFMAPKTIPNEPEVNTSEYKNEAVIEPKAVRSLLDDESQSGVTARSDGYCFGKQSVIDAIEATAQGELVVVVDDESRENEGDFIAACDLVTAESMATMIRYTSGVLCIGMEGERMDELNLPPMVSNNEDPKGTAFSVSVDAVKEHGITTGISALDRAITLKLLANPSATAADFNRPGHIFPLRAREGGVLARDGHTEASVDLARLAGCNPAGVLCEIVSEENPVEMARLPELKRFCKKHGFALTSIVDIAQYRRDTEGL